MPTILLHNTNNKNYKNKAIVHFIWDFTILTTTHMPILFRLVVSPQEPKEPVLDSRHMDMARNLGDFILGQKTKKFYTIAQLDT